NNNKSELTLKLQTLNENDISVDVKTYEVFGGHGSPGDLYYVPASNTYFILKSKAYGPFFSDLDNTNVWQNVGHDRDKAIQIVKQQKIEESSQPY
ncbi:TPA: hypothetical protein KIK79_004605, partial [Escherichia coli]|nr:hypothetical protein [Escherichia coli]